MAINVDLLLNKFMSFLPKLFNFFPKLLWFFLNYKLSIMIIISHSFEKFVQLFVAFSEFLFINLLKNFFRWKIKYLVEVFVKGLVLDNWLRVLNSLHFSFWIEVISSQLFKFLESAVEFFMNFESLVLGKRNMLFFHLIFSAVSKSLSLIFCFSSRFKPNRPKPCSSNCGPCPCE